MKIVFDCGGTKIAVAIVAQESEPVIIAISKGYNALTAGDGELTEALRAEERLSQGSNVEEVRFYGAGCATARACDKVRGELSVLFPGSEVYVDSDMLGAARAACGNSEGIVGILGTGSNSCLYDGMRIVDSVPSLGYILGDEGGGAVLGKIFLGLLFKRQLPETLSRLFEERYHLTVADVITRTYSQPYANTFFASFVPFIAENICYEEVRRFVTDEFRRYVRYNLKNYNGFGRLPVHFVGSVALHFKDFIEEALRQEGGISGNIVMTPIEHLAGYHRYTL